MSMIQKNKNAQWFIFAFLVLAAIYVLFPIAVVLMNSFKGRLFISTEPFLLPSTNPDNPTFVGLSNSSPTRTHLEVTCSICQLSLSR